jgi:hypothetical protein
MRELEDQPVVAPVESKGFGGTVKVRRAENETSDIIRQHDDTRRLLRAHFSEMVNDPRNHVDALQKELRLVVQEYLTNPLMERGKFSVSKIFARIYGRPRVNRIRRDKPGDPVFSTRQGEFLDTPDSNPLAIDDEYFSNGRPIPIYRHESAKDLEDLGLSLVSADGKRLMGGPPSARGIVRTPGGVAPKKPVGHKKFKGSLEADMRDMDISNAYYHSLAAQNEFFEMRDMLEQLSEFGRPVLDIETAIPKSERWVNIDALDRILRVGSGTKVRFADLVGDGVEQQEALHQAVKEALSVVGEEGAETLARWRAGGARPVLYAIPRRVADDLEKLLKPFFGGSASVRVFFDRPTAAWRSAVLSLSPRWVVNNTIGNMIFLKLQGGKLTDVLRQFQPKFRKQLREALGQKGEDLLGPGFAESVNIPIPKGQSGVERFAQKAAEKIERSPLKYIKSASQRVRHVNSIVEDAFRFASALSAAEKVAVRKGVQRTASSFWSAKKRMERLAEAGGDPKLLDEIADTTNRFFNDYQFQSPYGRSLVRRFIYPFWGFYKHMMKLTLQMPFEHAERFVAFRQISQVGNDIAEEYGPLPNYAEGAYRIGPGTVPGSFDFLSTRGANPFEGMGDPINKALVSAHPALRILMEQVTGRSTFTGRKFSDEDVVTPFGSDQQFRITKDAEGNPTGAEAVDKVTPNLLEHLLQMVPQYELTKDAIAGGRVADTTTILGALRGRLTGTGEGLERRAETGEPVSPVDAREQLARLFGYSVFNVNTQGFQERLTKDAEAALKYYMKLQAAAEKAG